MLTFFLNSLARFAFSPLAPTIESDLALGHAAVGSIFLLVSLGYSVMLFTSGFISARLTHHWTIVLSCAFLGVALSAISLSQTQTGVRIGLVALGLAAGLYLPSGLASLTATIDAKNWGKAIGIHELAPILAALSAPILSGIFLKLLGWRGILALIGVLCFAIGIAHVILDKGTRIRGETPSRENLHPILTSRSLWIMVALFGLGIAGNNGVYSMLPLYLVAELGVSQMSSDAILSLSRVPGLFIVALSGWATDRFGARRTMTSALILTGLVTLFLGLAQPRWIPSLIFLQSLLAVSFFPPAFAALSKLSSLKKRNLMVAIAIPIAVLVGGGAVPSLIGIAGQSGSFGLGIAVLGGVIVGGVLLITSVNHLSKRFS